MTEGKRFFEGPDDFDTAVRGHIGACAWKVFPLVASGFIAVFGWGVSIETRINNIQTIQAERTIKIAAMEVRISDIARAAYDPSPKPETKVGMEALKTEHESLKTSVERLEDRINNLHNYLLQIPIPGKTSPSLGRRGTAPFKPEIDG